MGVLKVETDIISSIPARTRYDTSDNVCRDLQNWHYDKVFDITLTNNFQYQRQFVDTDDIIRWDQWKKYSNYRLLVFIKWQNSISYFDRGNSNHEDFVDMVIIVMENLNNRKQRTVECSKRDCKSYVGCDLEGLESGEYTVACLAFKHLNEGKENKKIPYVVAPLF